jgi:hypothetical protein
MVMRGAKRVASPVKQTTIMMQCVPIRYAVDGAKVMESRLDCSRVVVVYLLDIVYC